MLRECGGDSNRKSPYLLAAKESIIWKTWARPIDEDMPPLCDLPSKSPRLLPSYCMLDLRAARRSHDTNLESMLATTVRCWFSSHRSRRGRGRKRCAGTGCSTPHTTPPKNRLHRRDPRGWHEGEVEEEAKSSKNEECPHRAIVPQHPLLPQHTCRSPTPPYKPYNISIYCNVGCTYELRDPLDSYRRYLNLLMLCSSLVSA